MKQLVGLLQLVHSAPVTLGQAVSQPLDASPSASKRFTSPQVRKTRKAAAFAFAAYGEKALEELACPACGQECSELRTAH